MEVNAPLASASRGGSNEMRVTLSALRRWRSSSTAAEESATLIDGHELNEVGQLHAVKSVEIAPKDV